MVDEKHVVAIPLQPRSGAHTDDSSADDDYRQLFLYLEFPLVGEF
jgi:hypothetical protein